MHDRQWKLVCRIHLPHHRNGICPNDHYNYTFHIHMDLLAYTVATFLSRKIWFLKLLVVCIIQYIDLCPIAKIYQKLNTFFEHILQHIYHNYPQRYCARICILTDRDYLVMAGRQRHGHYKHIVPQHLFLWWNNNTETIERQMGTTLIL